MTSKWKQSRSASLFSSLYFFFSQMLRFVLSTVEMHRIVSKTGDGDWFFSLCCVLEWMPSNYWPISKRHCTWWYAYVWIPSVTLPKCNKRYSFAMCFDRKKKHIETDVNVTSFNASTEEINWNWLWNSWTSS